MQIPGDFFFLLCKIYSTEELFNFACAKLHCHETFYDAFMHFRILFMSVDHNAPVWSAGNNIRKPWNGLTNRVFFFFLLFSSWKMDLGRDFYWRKKWWSIFLVFCAKWYMLSHDYLIIHFKAILIVLKKEALQTHLRSFLRTINEFILKS